MNYKLCLYKKELSYASIAKRGHLDCLKYAHENGAPMPRYIVDQAFYMFMQPYNKKIVKYLHEQTNIVSIRISYYMASFDNLEGLQYIYNIGIPFSRDTCLIA